MERDMGSHALLPRSRPAKPASRGQAAESYASPAATRALIEQGQAARLARLDSPDMVNTDQAAALAGATRATVIAWIEQGRCIGLKRAIRGYRLPAWQFEPTVLQAMPAISEALQTRDGWALLSFMETPQGALQGRTPRQALEQGQVQRVIALAGAE
jgi:hypothetical protein